MFCVPASHSPTRLRRPAARERAVPLAYTISGINVKEKINLHINFVSRACAKKRTEVASPVRASRPLSGEFERAGVELVIGALFREQLFVGAALDDAAVVEHHDDV